LAGNLSSSRFPFSGHSGGNGYGRDTGHSTHSNVVGVERGDGKSGGNGYGRDTGHSTHSNVVGVERGDGQSGGNGYGRDTGHSTNKFLLLNAPYPSIPLSDDSVSFSLSHIVCSLNGNKRTTYMNEARTAKKTSKWVTPRAPGGKFGQGGSSGGDGKKPPKDNMPKKGCASAGAKIGDKKSEKVESEEDLEKERLFWEDLSMGLPNDAVIVMGEEDDAEDSQDQDKRSDVEVSDDDEVSFVFSADDAVNAMGEEDDAEDRQYQDDGNDEASHNDEMISDQDNR
jgi:hypothetical protein